MKIIDILQTDNNVTNISLSERRLLKTCTQFLYESKEQPLLKNLRLKNLREYHKTVTKVKVRFHNRTNIVIETFNSAFEQKHGISNLHQRSIFANGIKSFNEGVDMKPYYIFPKNGYKFMYNVGVENYNETYKYTFDSLHEQFGDTAHAATLMTDLLQYTYTSSNLAEGISTGAEIIIYDIPFYYAVSQEAIEYPALLSLLK